MCCACHFNDQAWLHPEYCPCSTQAQLWVGNVPLEKVIAQSDAGCRWHRPAKPPWVSGCNHPGFSSLFVTTSVHLSVQAAL